MKLGDFIEQNLESILQAWENFARKNQPSGGNMNVVELRDHLSDMLRTIALDLASPQTERQRLEKSNGEQPDHPEETAAEIHADERVRAGFSISLLVAEYRALRASVLQMWLQGNGNLHEEGVEELIRFNEAVDQALAESVARYSETVESAQTVFIGILSHDLRTPLQSLGIGAQYLLYTPEQDPELVKLGTRMFKSVKRMGVMLDNLSDFTQSRLGSGMNLDLSHGDLAHISRDVVEEFQSYNKDRGISNSVQGDCTGTWDAGKLGQIYQNLVSNALQHGCPDGEIRVSSEGTEKEVVLRVHNSGTPIPEHQLGSVFNLFQRLAKSSEAAPQRNLGLGLYIVKEIVEAHQGQVSVTSTEQDGTTFEVKLPKVVAAG